MLILFRDMLLVVTWCYTFLFSAYVALCYSRRRYRYAVCERHSLREQQFVPVWYIIKQKPPRDVVVLFYGAPSGIRTRDPLIKSQLLYQLS